jgi:hypothetical protein
MILHSKPLVYEVLFRKVPAYESEILSDGAKFVSDVIQGLRLVIPTGTRRILVNLLGSCWAFDCDARPTIKAVQETLSKIVTGATL